MNCPYCGSVVRENEKFCQNCGAALAQTDEAAPPAPIQEAAPSAETPVFTAQQAPRGMSFREFIKSPYCTPDVNKTIRARAGSSCSSARAFPRSFRSQADLSLWTVSSWRASRSG